jgi:hypothetical protein
LKAAKQEQGEPVAWRLESGQAVWFERTDPEASSALPNDVTAIPLYTTPQQRTWVGLTDEEVEKLDCVKVMWQELDRVEIHGVKEFYRNIETKLKEKNNA